jgi:methanethiol S-methyltransferase
MDEEKRPFIINWGRLGGTVFGFGNQILFLVTVWFLFWFLRDGSLSKEHLAWVQIDFLLTLFFAVSHSILLAPWCRAKLRAYVPAAFYDSMFSAVTCFCLLILFAFWRTSESSLWEIDGLGLILIRTGFYASWLALFYSLALTGLGYQNGWTPFYYWLIKKSAPKRTFQTNGAYKYLRHPVYLSFLGLIWFTPRMSLDHALLTSVWTGYIFLGSVLKDKRLARFIGKPYVDYARRVPGYPFFFCGPLGRCEPKSEMPSVLSAKMPINSTADSIHDPTSAQQL